MALNLRDCAGTHLLVLTLLGGAILLPDLGQEKHLENREDRHAEISREMLQTGEYAIPRLLGQPYIDKPPLFNWSVAGLYRLTGRVSIWEARLPSAVSCTAIALAVYLLGRRWFGARTGLWAGIIWLTFPVSIQWGRMARMDMMLACLVVYAMLLADLAAQQKGPSGSFVWWCCACGVASLAVLSKGPQGALYFAGATALIWRARRGRWAPPVAFIAIAVGILFLPAAAWAAACELHRPGHLRALFGYQFGEGLKEHSKRLWLYLDQVPLWTAPWAGFGAGAAYAAVRHVRRVGYELAAVAPLFFAICFIAVTALPNKRLHYILPALPMWALLLGWFLDRAAGAGGEDAKSAAARWLFRLPLWGCLIVVILAAIAAPVALGLQHSAGLAAVVPLAAADVGIAACGLALARRRRTAGAVWALAAAVLLTASAVYPMMTHYIWKQAPDIAAARLIGEIIPPGMPAAIYDVRNEVLPLMLRRPVEFLRDETGLAAFLAQPGPRCAIVKADDADRIAQLRNPPLRPMGTWWLENGDLAATLLVAKR